MRQPQTRACKENTSLSWQRCRAKYSEDNSWALPPVIVRCNLIAHDTLTDTVATRTNHQVEVNRTCTFYPSRYSRHISFSVYQKKCQPLVRKPTLVDLKNTPTPGDVQLASHHVDINHQMLLTWAASQSATENIWHCTRASGIPMSMYPKEGLCSPQPNRSHARSHQLCTAPGLSATNPPTCPHLV